MANYVTIEGNKHLRAKIYKFEVREEEIDCFEFIVKFHYYLGLPLRPKVPTWRHYLHEVPTDLIGQVSLPRNSMPQHKV